MSDAENNGHTPEEPEGELLVSHEIARVWTDERAILQLKVDLPDGAKFQTKADVVALAYLVGKLTRFLAEVVENGARDVMNRRRQG